MDIVMQIILNSLIAGAIYTLMALGFKLTYSATKFFNLAHGIMAVVGAYTVFFLFKQHDVNVWASVATGILVAGLAGLVLDKLVYLPLRRRKASSLIFLVASLGAFTAIQALIAIIFKSEFQTLYTSASPKLYEIGGGVVTQLQLSIMAAGLLIMIGLAALVKYTKFGKSITAISDDHEVAKIVGINTDKLIGYIFFIGSAIAGLAGIMVGFDAGIEPTMGLGMLLKGVIAAIIGGVGNIYGGLIGSYLLAFIENFGIWKIPAEWKDAIAFGVLIVFLLVRPRGLFKK